MHCKVTPNPYFYSLKRISAMKNCLRNDTIYGSLRRHKCQISVQGWVRSAYARSVYGTNALALFPNALALSLPCDFFCQASIETPNDRSLLHCPSQ